MINFSHCARFFCGSMVCLLSACASTSGSTSEGEPRKVAAMTCEVTEAKIGSNMNHRSCVPSAFVPPTAAPAPATPVNSPNPQ